MRFVWILALLLPLGCDAGSDASPTEREPAVAEEEPPARPERCGAEEAWTGGQILEAPDGARIYYRTAGPTDAPALVFVHGGPGYNSYGFEQAVGAALERSLRMVYFDQRGCGRSAGGPGDLALGMDPTVEDIERLRAHLGIERWSVMGHSFGGLVARVYAARHPGAVEKLVMIDTTADLPAALEHQVQTLAARMGESSPEVARIAAEERPPMERLLAIYQIVGRVQTQRHLQWGSEEAQRRGERWDSASRLLDCTRDGVLPAYREGGWTDAHPELMGPIERPVLFLVGRRSEVLGAELATRTAQGWGAQTIWLEESGHFPFVEEPEAFANAVTTFVRPPPPEPRRRR
jgi:proline iminopeptidase